MSPDDKGYRAIDEHEQTFSPIAEQADCIAKSSRLLVSRRWKDLGA